MKKPAQWIVSPSGFQFTTGQGKYSAVYKALHLFRGVKVTMNLLYIDRPLVINPALAVKIGLNEAIILQQLNYWLTRTDSGVSYDGVQWVYNTYSEWQEQVPFFSERTIQRTILKLEKIGIVRSGMLRKSKGDRTKFYTINQSHELLAPSSRQSGTTITTDCLDHRDRMAPPSCQNGTLSTETTTETTTDLKPLSCKQDDAVKHTVECSLIDYLNQLTNRNYRPVPSTTKLLRARLAEGYTAQEIADVVARKCVEWLDDPKMAQYLRPATLFNAEKFNQYVGELGQPLPQKRQVKQSPAQIDDNSTGWS